MNWHEYIQAFLSRAHNFVRHIEGMWKEKSNHLFIIIVIVVVAPLVLLYAQLIPVPENFPKDELIPVPEGATLTQITQSFEDAGVVRSALILRAAVTYIGGAESVHAGDYVFKKETSVWDVAKALVTGNFGLEPVRILIPEGATAEDIAILMGRKLPRFDKAVFLSKALPMEGYLFPDTYFFLPNATEDIVLEAMLDNFERAVAEIETELEEFGQPLEDIVVMASLLEKEASIYEDKRKIAGVLWRRLDIDMALQVDATFIYFLGKNTFTLTLEDLRHESPYNTYRHKGLPPGAIANPGLSSLRAAVLPIDTGALFYLADHSGVTHYSKTYQQHLQKKAIYLD